MTSPPQSWLSSFAYFRHDLITLPSVDFIILWYNTFVAYIIDDIANFWFDFHRYFDEIKLWKIYVIDICNGWLLGGPKTRPLGILLSN